MTQQALVEELRKWWNEVNDICASLEYYPNASKCWLVTKPEKEEDAKNVFAGTAINISTQGQKHLGAVLGSRSHLEVYVSEKVEGWVGKVVRLGCGNPTSGLLYSLYFGIETPVDVLFKNST